MVDYADSSQLNRWLFASEQELGQCRCFANYTARTYLFDRETEISGKTPTASGVAATGAADSSVSTALPEEPLSSTVPSAAAGGSSIGSIPVSHFACDAAQRLELMKQNNNNNNNEGATIGPSSSYYAQQGPFESPSGKPYLSAAEEGVLVSFYASKLPALIGPAAQVRRLRRESKVLATAAALFRRFYLSNSVLLFDPKTIMVAAAFLASKVEDATTDVRYLQEGTVVMDAAVAIPDIVAAEVHLLAGVHFHLLCFHPYKAVLALTEDLRTFLKTAAGQNLLLLSSSSSETLSSSLPPHQQQLTGQDLKPMYDAARVILDDVVVADVPLLYSPGQIGLAALMVAQENVQQTHKNTNTTNDDETDSAAADAVGNQPRPPPPQIDLLAYLTARFPHHHESGGSAEDWMPSTLQTLAGLLRQLKDGLHGCGNYQLPISQLKSIHKKLKAVRAWGRDATKKGDKKRNKSSSDSGAPASKRIKTE